MLFQLHIQSPSEPHQPCHVHPQTYSPPHIPKPQPHHEAPTAIPCSFFPASSAGARFALAGPITHTPSLENRLPCTGQSNDFSAEFQQTTPFRCGHSALNFCTFPFSSLYTAKGLDVPCFSPLALKLNSKSDHREVSVERGKRDLPSSKHLHTPSQDPRYRQYPSPKISYTAH